MAGISSKKYESSNWFKRFIKAGIASSLIGFFDYSNNAIAEKPKCENNSYVIFEFDKTNLDSLDKKLIIDRISGLGNTINVTGYACTVGDSAYNSGLSRRRAESVANFIRSCDSTRIVNVFYIGETNEFEDDPNRRVNISGTEAKCDKSITYRLSVYFPIILNINDEEAEHSISAGLDYYFNNKLWGSNMSAGKNIGKGFESGIKIDYILGKTIQDADFDTISTFKSGNYVTALKNINQKTDKIGLEAYLSFIPIKNLSLSAGIGGSWNSTSSNGSITRTMYNSENEIRDRDIDDISDKVSYGHFEPQASFGIGYTQNISGDLDFEVNAEYETINGASIGSGLRYRFE